MDSVISSINRPLTDLFPWPVKLSNTWYCWVQGTVASVQQDMQQRLEEALAENKAQAESLREARERNMHFSARVVALNSRVAQLTKQV